VEEGSEALSILRFAKNMAARDAEMVLRSAVANLSNFEDGKKSVNNDDVKVKAAFVDQGRR
jgi:ribosomal protein L22